MTWPVHPAAGLFPLLGDEELRELAEDIKANGLHEPVWLWNDPERGTVLLDGRNRVRACELAGVQYTTQTYSGDDPIAFSISLNLKRRHLDTWDRAAAAAAVEQLYAVEAKKRQGQRTDLLPNVVENSPQSALERKSREKAARLLGTTGNAVSAYKRVMEKAPDLVQQRASQASGKRLALGRADRILRDREAERRRVEQARRDAERLAERPRVDLRHGDFREVLADLKDIDAVITDPPYPREYLPLLGDLAAWADKVLSDDGVLAVLFGQTYLPEVYRLLDGHRPYRWTMAYLTPGAGYASQYAKVQSNWKPVLIYGGGPRFADVLRSEGTDAGAKDLHYWGQDYGAFHTLIGRLTRPGQTVVDPFMGSGTTLLAAHAQGRHVIGADVDAAHVATARERLA